MRLPEARQAPSWAVVLLTLLSVALLGGVGVLAWSLLIPLPDAAVSTSIPSSAPASSGPVFDATASAALHQIAQVMQTSAAPTETPLPPTPTYAVSTQIPNTPCGTWVPLGAVCEMPLRPKPSPTAIPDCPVAPRDLCIWRGSLTPQPSPGSAS